MTEAARGSPVHAARTRSESELSFVTWGSRHAKSLVSRVRLWLERVGGLAREGKSFGDYNKLRRKRPRRQRRSGGVSEHVFSLSGTERNDRETSWPVGRDVASVFLPVFRPRSLGFAASRHHALRLCFSSCAESPSFIEPRVASASKVHMQVNVSPSTAKYHQIQRRPKSKAPLSPITVIPGHANGSAKCRAAVLAIL